MGLATFIRQMLEGGSTTDFLKRIYGFRSNYRSGRYNETMVVSRFVVTPRFEGSESSFLMPTVEEEELELDAFPSHAMLAVGARIDPTTKQLVYLLQN